MAPPLDFGSVKFINARESGIDISLLGSGTYDHIGFFGSQGEVTAVQVGSYQDTTIIVDDNGVPLKDHLGQELPFGGSGYMTNAKNVGAADTVQLSGLPDGPGVVNITDVNIFDPNNLTIEPFFNQISSGTVMLQYRASGVSTVHTFNAKLYAFDNVSNNIEVAAPDVTIQGFEINASGIWRNAAHSGVWRLMSGGRNQALEFADHSNANGYEKRNLHVWVAAISCRPDAVGILDEFDFAFETQFA
ncbi:MAG: hypothetical protein ACXACY_24690 [Candidatus Hodarchaeales archaeon]|jgi:hypothetical protein